MELATLQIIKEIHNVENSDHLDVVSVLGWKVVTRRNDFKPGDLCVYISLDSILPDKPEFEFMRDKKFRVHTVKLRGQISQGLVFPMSILPPEASLMPIGTDFTEFLEIEKYEKPIPVHLSGETAGVFPSYMPRTDEERIQNCIEILSELKGIECYSTVKIDGTSATFANFHNNNDIICSRTLMKKDTGNNIYSSMFRKYNISNIFREIKDIAIQGEIAGPSIQKNPLGLLRHEFLVFNIYNILKGSYYDYLNLVNFCDKYHLQMVDVDRIFIMNHTLEQLLEMAKGNYKSGHVREGIVIRPTLERFSETLKGGRSSFKVINNDYKD